MLAATLGACSVQVGGQDAGDDADSAAQADSTAADSLSKPIEAIPVEVALAHTGEISAHLLFNSTIETEAAVEIYPQISGLVKQLNVEEGDRVEAGDTLLSIEDKQLRIAAEEARANYDYQQTSFKRTETMFERNLISDQEFETNKYNFEQARLRLARARLELEYAEVIAPFSGVITERHVQVGARVGPSSKPDRPRLRARPIPHHHRQRPAGPYHLGVFARQEVQRLGQTHQPHSRSQKRHLQGHGRLARPLGVLAARPLRQRAHRHRHAHRRRVDTQASDCVRRRRPVRVRRRGHHGRADQVAARV
ncbi:MAG: efflux RND transporter periplasmic adaptor subunit [Candidatus Latescibacteria bacterium]|nr:efflux RND transporter periplasmic adaptor subunit [Candidatus Latescibacterota bacterium]